MAPWWFEKMLGQEQQYVAPPLPPGEQMQQTFAGSTMSGRGLGFGAEVGLYDNYLGVSPINVTGAQRLLGLGARAVGIPGFGGVNSLINRAVPQPQAIPYSAITSVGPGSGPGLFSPPTVQVQTTQGNYEVGVTGNLWALSRSQQAVQARNELMAALAARAGY